MPFSIQAKILRLLQEKRIERLGGREPISVDVRIIAATNRDLEAALAKGRFREDLYYRLKVVTLWLPPLRDRLEDVPLLADYFLARLAAEMGIDNPGINEEAKAFLSSRPWQGNVRELSNSIQKALIFSRGGPINLESISKVVGGERIFSEPDGVAEEAIRQWIRNILVSGTAKDTFNASIDHFASLMIAEALKLTRGNRSRAAELLGISRPTLLSRIEKYRIKMETSVEAN
jgi:DNA-binding NtrC family response regulator